MMKYFDRKKLVLLLILLIPLGACSSGGDGSTTVTITLTGKVTNGVPGGGQGNPATGITVTVTNIPKSSKATGTDGLYSISDIPAAGDYTVEAEDANAGGFAKITCTINIADSVTMNVTNDGGNGGQAACTKNGTMVLNITMS